MRLAKRVIVPALCLVAIGAAIIPPSGRSVPSARAQADPGFVDRVLASLTPDERIGQLVMVNFVGDDVSAASDIAALIRDFNVGGVLVSASNGNIVNSGDTPASIAALTNGLQDRSFAASSRERRHGRVLPAPSHRDR